MTTPAWPALMCDKLAGQYTSISTRMVWKLSGMGNFPRPVQLPGARIARWRKTDLDSYLESLEGAA